jgi:hypothetical protein
MATEKFFDDIGTVTGVAGINIDRNQFKRHRSSPAQVLQQQKERVGILAAGNRHRDAITTFDQTEVGYGFADAVPQLFEEPVILEFR